MLYISAESGGQRPFVNQITLKWSIKKWEDLLRMQHTQNIEEAIKEINDFISNGLQN